MYLAALSDRVLEGPGSITIVGSVNIFVLERCRVFRFVAASIHFRIIASEILGQFSILSEVSEVVDLGKPLIGSSNLYSKETERKIGGGVSALVALVVVGTSDASTGADEDRVAD